MTPVHQRLETPTETSEMKWHLIQIWSATSRSIDRSVTRLFYCVSQSQKQTLWTFAMMCLSMLCNCHDLKLTLLLLWTNGLTFRFTRRVRTVVKERWSILSQFCCKFTEVSVCQKLWKYYEVWQSYCKNNKGAIFASQSIQHCGAKKIAPFIFAITLSNHIVCW